MSKKSLIVFAAAALFLGGISLSFAQKDLEITYPSIPGIVTPVAIDSDITDYLRYVFSVLIMVSGLLVFASFVYAGVLYLISMGNPSRMNEARGRMLYSIIGLVIIFSSWLISNTINPKIVVPEFTAGPTGGIVLYKEWAGGGCDETREQKLIMGNYSYLSDFAGAECLRFVSRPGELRAKVYEGENYTGPRAKDFTSDIQADRDLRPSSLGYPIKSIKLMWNMPGVYLCTGALEQEAPGLWNCPGVELEKYLPAGTALFGLDFNDKTKGLELKPVKTTKFIGNESYVSATRAGIACDATAQEEGFSSGFGPVPWWLTKDDKGDFYCTFNTLLFGAILHEHADYSGECEVFLRTDDDLTDGNLIGKRASSATVFAQRKAGGAADEGVWLCEEVDQRREDCHGPYKPAPGEVIFEQPNLTGTGIPNASDCIINKDGISSIIIDGPYTAVLFDNENFTGQCNAFKSSDPNLRDDLVGRCCCIYGNWGCADCMSSFIIVATGGTAAE